MTTDNFLFLFAKQTNPNQSNRRSMVQWYFPLVFPASYYKICQFPVNYVSVMFYSTCPRSFYSPALATYIRYLSDLLFKKNYSAIFIRVYNCHTVWTGVFPLYCIDEIPDFANVSTAHDDFRFNKFPYFWKRQIRNPEREIKIPLGYAKGNQI